MPSCPHCQSTNVVVTEEVYTRKGRMYYRFWQTIWILLFIAGGVAFNELAIGFLLSIGSSVVVKIFSIINASKRSVSRTKVSCLSCRQKTMLS